MPMAPGTTDTPSNATPYADVLDRPSIPTSATSDMPVITPAETISTPVDNPAEAAEAVETSTAQPVEGEANGEPTKTPGEESDKSTPQQRAAFARERNRRQAAEQRATALEAKIDQLAESVSKLVDAGKPSEDPRPTRDKFDDPNAYDKALEDWAGRRAAAVARAEATAEAEAAQTKAAKERELKALTDAHVKRVDTFKATHPDYEDIVYDDTLFTNPVLGQAILEAEEGPAIAYHLAQNPEEHDRINALRPAMVVFEIGRLAARLTAPPARNPRHDPITPLKARNDSGPKDPNDMTMEEYVAWRKAKSN